MNELIEIYLQHKDKIESFLKDTFLNNYNNLLQYEKNSFKELFSHFKSLELVYIIDDKTKKQISPNFYSNKIDKNAANISRAYLLNSIDFNDIYITKPYKSSATGNLCITLFIKEKDKIIALDFNLKRLLERLKLLESHEVFNNITKYFYLFAGSMLIVFAFSILSYSFYEIVTKIHKITIMSFFKPIIYITIAIAIFDLAKTLIEQEVLFKSFKKEELEKKTFIKFMLSILIALAIETLMLVFKASLQNISYMQNALYLFIGISLLLFALTYFIKK